MKNFKRILALVLATIMVVGTMASVSAASGAWYQDAVNWIESNGIAVIGTNAEKKITRSEFVLWVAKIESAQLSDKAWNEAPAEAPFTDVDVNNASVHPRAITYSKQMGYIVGDGDGTFAPDRIVTFAEACAVIVRVMDFDDLVGDKSPANWKNNYMRAANTYAGAIDSTFLAKTDTYNPDYELSNGEAAYLLATICNYKVPGVHLTGYGIDLGDRLKNAVGGSVGKTYYVTDIPRAVFATWTVPAPSGTRPPNYPQGTVIERYTAEFNSAKAVTLASTSDPTDTITIPGDQFMKLLGITGTASADLISVFSKINIGNLVNVVADKSTGAVTSLAVANNTTTVDTYLQAKGYNNNATNNRFIGWAVTGNSGTNYQPTLPTTYSTDLVTSWTNVTRNASNVVTSAVLNFKGQTFRVADSGSEIAIYKLADLENTISANEAVNSLINAAQGECSATFNDVDGDGTFDVVIINESNPFIYSADPNVSGDSTDFTNYYSSLSTVADVAAQNYYIAATETDYNRALPKNNPYGTVTLNTKTEYSNISSANINTDPYTLKNNIANGKMQLVLCASNAHQAATIGYNASYGQNTLPFYMAYDLAEFGVGIIEKVDATVNNGYWTAVIRNTDGSFKTVLIPQTAASVFQADVTIGGATATYAFDCSTWMTFLTDTLKDELIAKGIVSAVANIYDAAYKDTVGAQMVGHYVQYATDALGNVVCMIGTDATTGISGFVANVKKTTTGDNTYDVTVATTGSGFAVGNVYLSKLTDADIGNDIVGGQHLKTVDIGGVECVVFYDLYNYSKRTSYRGNAAYAKDMATGTVYKMTNWAAYVDGTGTFTATVDSTNGAWGWCRVMVDGAWNYGGLTGAGTIQTTVKTQNDGTVVNALCGRWGDNIYDYVDNRAKYGVADIATFEVRANASSMFDWANYAVYNTLFSGKYGDPNAMVDGRIDAGHDLIYVTVKKDGGSAGDDGLYYITYGDEKTYAASSATETCGAGFRLGDLGKVSNTSYTYGSYWYMTYSGEVSPQDNWIATSTPYVISITEKSNAVKTNTKDGLDVVNGYTSLYDLTVGYKPYYDRVAKSGGYEYTVKFEEVKVFTDVVGTTAYALDTTKTVMYAMYAGGTGLDTTPLVDKDNTYKNDNRYYVDPKTNYVYSLIAATTVYDSTKTTFTYDESTGSLLNTYTAAAGDSEVLFSEHQLGKYAVVTFAEKSYKDAGYYPGCYWMYVDGTKYSVTNETKVAIVTPDTSVAGFTTTIGTVGEFANKAFFVTDTSVATSLNALKGVAFIGEEAKGYTGGGTTTPVTSEGTLVYLAANAKPVVVSGLYDTTWNVESSASAYSIDGTEVGTIYRAYSTYTEAQKASLIDLTIVGGHWYRVTDDGEIISDATAGLVKSATVTSATVNGTTKGTFDSGKTTVDMTSYKFVFIYRSADESAIVKAGNSTTVSIASKEAYVAACASKLTAYNTAKDAYNAAASKVTAQSVLEEKKAAMDAAYADLIATKEAYINAHFNGQMWNVANSPFYQYIELGKSFQAATSSITFDYVLVGDTYYVFTDSFVY